MVMLKKAISAELQLKDASGSREFTGYGNTFNNKDLVGDITMPGAFAKSLEEHSTNGTMPQMFMYHDRTRPVGVYTHMEEDEKGLRIEGRLTEGVRDSDEAYALMKDGALNSFSIGYHVIDEEYDSRLKANLLREVSLIEVSLVTVPANPESLLESVKDAEGKPQIRTAELALRDAGFSRREARAILKCGFSAIVDEQDTSANEEVENLFAKALAIASK